MYGRKRTGTEIISNIFQDVPCAVGYAVEISGGLSACWPCGPTIFLHSTPVQIKFLTGSPYGNEDQQRQNNAAKCEEKDGKATETPQTFKLSDEKMVDVGKWIVRPRRHHRLLLTKAAEAYDRADEARAAIEKHGTTYLDRFDQPCARPKVAIERDSRLAFARLVRELNLSEAPDDPPRPNSLRFGGRK
jgi:hypothetical protein